MNLPPTRVSRKYKMQSAKCKIGERLPTAIDMFPLARKFDMRLRRSIFACGDQYAALRREGNGGTKAPPYG